MEFPTGPGVLMGPINPDAWKRAVYRSPPTLFTVEVLQPEKQGGSFSFGFRISPIRGDNVSLASSTGSSSSKGSTVEYCIWRRWDDCLWFQDTLEVEYARASREKRTRLAAGKGVKKDGVYIQSDFAASFDSLPPGPDPNSIALDIHDCIPKLTKKGTIFRPSLATIQHRNEELQAMVAALFQEDVPMLIRELRSTRTFTDFFGFWRRDHDLALKRQKSIRDKPRHSISSSVFSSYFPTSSPDLTDIPPSPVVLQAPSIVPTARTTRGSVTSDTSSDNSSGSNSTGSLLTPPRPPQPSRQPIIVPQDVPIMFGHNPQSNDRTTVLESLPEDRELSSPSRKLYGEDIDPVSRRRKSNVASEINRNCRIFISGSNNVEETDEFAALNAASRAIRHSWQSTSSVSSIRPSVYFADLDVDLALPSPAPEHRYRPRASVSSIASFMTDCSTDAILPRSQFADVRRSRSRNSHRALTEDEAWDEDNGDVLDAYFYGMTFDDYTRPVSMADPTRLYSLGRCETPTGDRSSSTTTSSSDHHSILDTSYTYSHRRSSFSTSVSSDSGASYQECTISVKAIHNNSIIMLRVPRTVTFSEVRDKIYEKFVRQQGVALSESFAIAHLADVSKTSTGRARSDSLTTREGPDHAKLEFINSQEHWDYVIAGNPKNKVLLRVIGTRSY